MTESHLLEQDISWNDAKLADQFQEVLSMKHKMTGQEAYKTSSICGLRINRLIKSPRWLDQESGLKTLLDWPPGHLWSCNPQRSLWNWEVSSEKWQVKKRLGGRKNKLSLTVETFMHRPGQSTCLNLWCQTWGSHSVYSCFLTCFSPVWFFQLLFTWLNIKCSKPLQWETLGLQSVLSTSTLRNCVRYHPSPSQPLSL